MAAPVPRLSETPGQAHYAGHRIGQLARLPDAKLRRLVAELPGGTVIRADAEALRQAALALIDNAIKFSPPGGTVTVTASQDAGHVRFCVADEGPGFSGEDGTAVLDRYAQESVGRAAGGSGLGLAIARWIAEQHGGMIRAANRESGGAEVVLEIPR